MSWTDAQQKLARAVYAATLKASKYAPMDHVVSVGNVLMRAFDRKFFASIYHGGRVSVHDMNAAALTVRDQQSERNRFSGVIPAFGALPLVQNVRGGALYCAKDVRAQMAEMLQYTPGSAARPPGSLPFPTAALHQLCMVMIKPVADLSLVTLAGEGANVGYFYDELQRAPDVRAALALMKYRDITEAIFSTTEHSAARGFGLGLIANPGIDGIEVGSARSFETLSSASPMSLFKSGTNVLIFGGNNEVLSGRLRIVQVTLLDQTHGGFEVVTLTPRSNGFFEEASRTRL